MSTLQRADQGQARQNTISGFFTRNPHATDDGASTEEPTGDIIAKTNTDPLHNTKNRPADGTSDEMSAGRPTSIVCPICSETQSSRCLLQFNRHVDVCLARSPSTAADRDQSSTETHDRSSATVTDCLTNNRHLRSCTTATVDSSMPQTRKNNNCRQMKTVDGEPACSVNDVGEGSTARQSEAATSGLVTPDRMTAGHFLCPVCQTMRVDADLSRFNDHVDSCLTRHAVRDMLQEDRQSAPIQTPLAKRRKTDNSGGKVHHKPINDYFS